MGNNSHFCLKCTPSEVTILSIKMITITVITTTAIASATTAAAAAVTERTVESIRWFKVFD